MPDRTSATSPRGANPSYFQTARSLYGAAFGSHLPDDVREASSDWSSLSGAQRSYALAHLLYLNLQAQQVTHRLLSDLRESHEDLAEDVSTLTRVTVERLGPDQVREPAPSKLAPDAGKESTPLATQTTQNNPADVPHPEALGDDNETSLADLFNSNNTEVADESR